jgi:molybdopterin converting factor small subunit
MKPAILTLLILFFSTSLAQDKPKDVKLSGVKVVERLQQVEKAIKDRQQKLTDNDPEYQRLVGIYNGLALAISDTTLAPGDTVRLKK